MSQSVIIEGVTFDRTQSDLLLQFEKSLILLGKSDLIGLLFSLFFLEQIGYVNFKTQKQLAKKVGLSEPTFINKRNELERLKIITIIESGGRRTIHLNFLSRLKFFKLPIDPTKQDEYLDNMAKSVTLIGPEEGQLPLTHSIYNNNTHNTNNTKSTNTNDNTRYPKEDYNIVLTAFKKYKGVGLFGPEVGQCLRAIKTMFRAGRRPKEIIEFMKWLHDNETNEETSWVKTWTIWTVQKKLPEFVAGKLKVKTVEDEFPAYGK